MTSLPQDVGQLVLARKFANARSTSVKVDSAGTILSNGSIGTKGDNFTIIARENGNRENGNRKLSKRALSLKACKGKKGCEFAECAFQALGKVPARLQAKCPTVGIDKEKTAIRNIAKDKEE